MKRETANVIVIGYNLKDIESRCLSSIIKNTTYPYLLTFYDNYNKNTTLTEAWNKLIHTSPCEYIVLLNNDTVVTKDWLSKLVYTLDSDTSFGFVGPSTNSCHSPQKTIPTYEEAIACKNQIRIMKDPISGFCVLLKKSVWEQLGGFDGRYTLYGQESDLIDRAKQLGYKSVWCQGSFVYHLGEASIKSANINVKQEREKAKQLYWSEREK